MDFNKIANMTGLGLFGSLFIVSIMLVVYGVISLWKKIKQL